MNTERESLTASLDLVASMHEDDIASPIKKAAAAILSTTIATEKGRTFNDREDFGRCLYLLAVLSNAPEWDFLRLEAELDAESRFEWAVVEESFRSTYVHKDGLGSKKEAELWLAALEVTIGRERHEHFMRTDGNIMSKPMEIAWRKVDYWHREDPPLS